MNTNGQNPRKSRPKKSPRLEAIEASFELLVAIADPEQHREETPEKAAERVMEYMGNVNVPLGEDTADFFMPDEDEMVYVIQAFLEGPEALAVTLAALKAQNFMHGHIHAQVEAGTLKL
jgi:hypothetical protein